MPSNLNSFSDFPFMPIVLLAQDFNIVHCVFVASIREMFFNSRVDSLSDGVFFKASAEASSCFPDVVLGAVLALYVVYNPTLVFFLSLILGFY